MKGNARKVRRLYRDDVLAGFAGGTADAFTLFERLRVNWKNIPVIWCGQRLSWPRTGAQIKCLRRLEALLIVADRDRLAGTISGNGDVIEPEGGVIAIGSGGSYAKAAALRWWKTLTWVLATIVEKGLNIAADICIYTNQNLTIEELEL